MLRIEKTADDRLDVTLQGSLDLQSMRKGLDDLIAKAEGIAHGRMLYTVRDFEMPTLGALGVELQRLPQLFGLVGKFDRCAVVAEQGWIRTLADAQGAIIPGIDIKSFTDAGEAEAWLEGGAKAAA